MRSKDHSKGKSMNSSNHTERELVSFLNTQTFGKKKKVDLPGKYSKIYDELVKDELNVLDLGGAFLGESTVLKISELIPSRTKLKSVKLMNNKLGDDIFPVLIERCRNIGSLNLSYNNFTDKVLEYL
jgi:Ran GTPase-activating protein (RanGAP) involved in mRNA processing and transport